MMNKTMSIKADVEFTILGEACSKANSRRLVRIKGKPASIKSAKALAYVEAFNLQCRKLTELFTEDVFVEATIYYASRRPDLDESVILDCMQGRIYENDRQVKYKAIRWGLDKTNPRAEIKVGNLSTYVQNDFTPDAG
jgi:hypothetical protein